LGLWVAESRGLLATLLIPKSRAVKISKARACSARFFFISVRLMSCGPQTSENKKAPNWGFGNLAEGKVYEPTLLLS